MEQICFEQYRKLGKKGKPVIGNKAEWTVLCAIVKKDKQLECVSIGTGLKCLPEKLLEKGGRLVNDSHAEIVCRRAFKRYLLDQVTRCKNAKDSVFESIDDRYRIRKEVSFHMYLSLAPCGDASMEDLGSLKRPYEMIENTSVRLRGRDHGHVLGVTRTKPGRIDSDYTASMSCSDKIAKWTVLGIQGALLGIIMDPVYLKSITVSEGGTLQSLERALNSRTENANGEDLYRFHRLDIHKSDQIFEHSQSQVKLKHPNLPVHSCTFSIGWAKGFEQESIANYGRKQGAAKVKGSYAYSASSALCKAKILDEFSLLHVHQKTYYELKQSHTVYQRVKSLLYDTCLSGWNQNPPELEQFTCATLAASQ
ncbi:adenosine deaminase/editase [Gorgonomyces haynaldii]|nr:adenosine deaminase/editase [Gorgonomyces haynaldii]